MANHMLKLQNASLRQAGARLGISLAPNSSEKNVWDVAVAGEHAGKSVTNGALACGWLPPEPKRRLEIWQDVCIL